MDKKYIIEAGTVEALVHLLRGVSVSSPIVLQYANALEKLEPLNEPKETKKAS